MEAFARLSPLDHAPLRNLARTMLVIGVVMAAFTLYQIYLLAWAGYTEWIRKR